MSRQRLRIVIVIIVALVVGATATYLILHKQQPKLTDVHVIERLVGRHYVLPTDEQPALATVTDPSKVTTKFLQKAKQGDKILIYQKNSRVIIYRPSIDRIIDVGPVEIAPLSPSEEQTK
jgi:hypothetical protein